MTLPTGADHGAPPPIAALLFPVDSQLQAELAKRFEIVHWHSSPQEASTSVSVRNRILCAVTSGPRGISAQQIDRLPSLRFVAVLGAGYDHVDLAALRSRGIAASNTPDVLTDDVADLALGLALAIFRQIPAADRFVRSGAWLAGAMPLGRRLGGRRFGIVGLGRIGKAIAARFAPLGPVAYTGTRPQPVPYAFYPTVKELALASDVLVLAASANPSTRRMVDRSVLDALGPDGYLINIARGSLVDENELIAALREKRIAGAGLDVFETEPCTPSVFADIHNVVLTPHVGTATQETRSAMAQLLLANVDAFLEGVSLVSPIA
jgi:lactate dehydrogenase-like 2-hydroxyacid dehydrogenase